LGEAFDLLEKLGIKGLERPPNPRGGSGKKETLTVEKEVEVEVEVQTKDESQ
jgi:hypothetical protein